tara:strand:+ start:391 stop:1299 length:909 start_codon:yes stop_codon:yes gene_type:complete
MTDLNSKELKQIETIMSKLREKAQPKRKQRTHYRAIPFTNTQLQKLFASIDNVLISMICFLALRFGLRRFEVLRLRIEDFDFKSKQFTFIGAKTRRPAEFYIDKRTAIILKKWFTLLGRSEGWVFPSHKSPDGKYSDCGFSNKFKKYMKKAGLLIPNTEKINHSKKHLLTFYNLRHTFCSLIAKAVDMGDGHKLMRHKRMEMTMKHYYSISLQNQQKAFVKAFDLDKKNNTFNDLESDREAVELFEDTSGTTSQDRIMPLELLQRKLVLGKITTKEYSEKIKLLQGGDTSDNKGTNTKNYIG